MMGYMDNNDLKSLQLANLSLKRDDARSNRDFARIHDCAQVQLVGLALGGYQQFLVEYDHIRFHKYGELFFGWASAN